MDNKMTIKSTKLIVCSFLAITLGVFGPLELYLTNINEFWFSIKDICWIVLLGGVFIFLASYLPGLVLKGKTRELYLCLLFGLGLGFYLQGNFINADYNVLNGESIDWSAYTGVATVNTLFWLLCLAIPFIIRYVASDQWKNIIKYTSVVIIITQIVTLCVLGITTDFSKREDKNDFYLTTEGQFSLSKKQNIVIFILDSFDSMYFKELLKEYPDLETSFSDFTYYPDTVGGATRTTLAIPFIMTGKAWTEPVSYNEYLEKAFSEAELYDVLKQNNYDIRVYTNSRLIPASQIGTFENYEKGKMVVSSNYLLAKYLYKLTAFRYMPHLLKSPFWFYGEVFNELKVSDVSEIYTIDDAKFYRDFIEDNLSVDGTQNAFRIYHLNGAHPPYTINEQAEKVSSDETSRLQQTRGVLRIIEEYLAQSKALGIYDNTTFIIMADHGEIGLEQNPLFLIKPFDVRKPFEINYAPISYFSLHPTLLSLITGNNGAYGNTIFDISAGNSATRLYYTNDSKGNKTKIVEYKVEGYAWDSNDIKATGNVFMGDSENIDYSYELGTELIFGSSGNATKYLENGFSVDEANHTWTEGNVSTIRLDLTKQPTEDLLVVIDAIPYVVAGPQRMIVSVNNTVVHQGIYSGKSDIKFPISTGLINGKTLILKFEFPDAVSPSEVSSSGESRVLAFDFYKLAVVEQKFDYSKYKYKIGTDIVFTNEDNGTRYFDYGISYVEDAFAWSLGKYSRLILNVGDINGPLFADIDLYSVFNGEQHVIIKSNNVALFDNKVDNTEKKIAFAIPADCIINGILILDFEFPDATSPYALGQSVDSRELAIAFKTITLNKN